MQIGYSFLGFGGSLFPVGVNEIISFGKNHIEVGVGYTFSDAFPRDHVAMRIGYRYQKPKGRLVFRPAFTPILVQWKIFPLTDKWEFMPRFGLAVGYCF